MSHQEPADRPTAVVFDLDGLMFNTEELYQDVCREMLRRRGKPFERDLLNRMMGQPARAAYQVMIEWHGLSDTFDTLIAETAEIFSSILDTRLAPMPGLFDLLDRLEARGLPKAVATSSGRAFVERVLGRFQLQPRFEFILTAEDIVEGKPAPEIYLKAAGRLGLTPVQMLVLEDSHHGCRAAVRAGAFAVAVPGDHSRDHDFTGARFIADSLRDQRVYTTLDLGPAPVTDS